MNNVAWYSSVAAAIDRAGFFTGGLEDKLGWSRTTICSCGPDVLSGSSLWVTVVEGHCFLGTWGNRIYRLPKTEAVADRIAELFTARVLRMGHKTQADIDERTKNEFGLVEVSEAEFDQVVASASKV